MTTKEVFLYDFMRWADVINENPQFYAVIAPDGVNTLVFKENTMVRKVFS